MWRSHIRKFTLYTLDGKKRIYVPKKRSQDFPMRGFLICPLCGKLLTGSSSQGRSKKHFYYHCKLPCKARFHTDNTHDLFSTELKKFIPRPGMIEVYQKVISYQYDLQRKDGREDLKAIKQELEQVNTRMVKARDLLLNDEFDAADYKTVKSECKRRSPSWNPGSLRPIVPRYEY